ncbi:hypothetical protein SLE2022_247960 [Rubroshorea leprosula]
MGFKNINIGTTEGVSNVVGTALLSSPRINREQMKNIQTNISTALVVDDDIINRKIHRKLLDNLGIESETVTNGKEAVDVHCDGKNFDLILMDLEMPIMNGIEATKKLREMGIHSMIAGVSTRSLEEEKQEFMDAGLNDFKEKPLTVAKLVSILHKFCEDDLEPVTD